jgi:predicted short-subunit dehydrogenase-like oxidoreductase (DUF2520 family)
MTVKEKIGFIGIGTVGTALALQFSNQGYPVAAASSLRMSSAERLAQALPGCKACGSSQEVADLADFVFVTTPDDAIRQVAEQVGWHRGQKVVHCSGADSLDVLETARQAGAFVGSFHPLQTFANIDQAIENLSGSTFALEAEEPLLSSLVAMAKALDGDWILLKAEGKVLYHAAAVFTSNYVVTLLKLATDLWRIFDIPPEKATRSLLPLLRGTVNNIGNIGLPGCLTGPIARGDLGTIRKHLKALRTSAPGLLTAYSELGLQTIPIALAKGKIDQERAEEMASLFQTDRTEKG